MHDARREAFRTARAYFAAAARYRSAARRGCDMETPTQELLGRSLFYSEALKKWPGEPARRRLAFLRRQLQAVTDRYGRVDGGPDDR